MGEEIIDVVGIGFGPSNLALAIAIQEHNQSGTGPQLTTEFIEKKASFGWHRGMLIEGATMQISFLKDLVTLRNPVSTFSFLSYLHAKDRMIDFINHKALFPSRIEFHDYLSWCAAQMSDQVRYGCEVVSASPVFCDGLVTHYEVMVRHSERNTLTAIAARNLVIAPGLVPRIPAGIELSEHVWHSQKLLDKMAEMAKAAAEPQRFIVLGAGQSAAEVVDYLHRTHPEAEVCALFSRFGYSQAEDSPFANQIFDPETVDAFHGTSDTVKSALMAYHANTNYSVVDVDLIEELYRRSYQEKVQGVSRLRMLNVSELAGAEERAGGVDVTVRHLLSGQLSVLAADALVCATGYESTDPLSLIPDVAPVLSKDSQGRLLVDRDYRLTTGPEVLGGIYLCGATEHTHGITSSLLSMAAVRAGEIVRSITEHAEAATAPPRVRAAVLAHSPRPAPIRPQRLEAQ